MSNKTLYKYRTYGAKEIENIGYYKHIVPTGLKSISHICKIAKLTLMVRFPNRTGTHKKTDYERFYHKFGAVRKPHFMRHFSGL